ncbi:MAG: hypothetical protein ABJL44_15595 [Algibacter sp.]
MNKPHLYTLILFVIFTSQLIAQTNNALSSSPYSLYGLGSTNDISTGTINGLGGFGYAVSSNKFINGYNPASFGSILSNSFLLDFGFKAQTNILKDGSDSSSNIIANFSNFALAFPLTKKSGFGVTLTPYTSVGYEVNNIVSNIEGSNDVFYTNIEGFGGISDLKLNYGYKLTDKIRLGLTTSVLFGQINQTETNILPTTFLTIEEESNYSGFRLGFGLQYDILKNTSFGATLNLPTSLSGDKTWILNDDVTTEYTDDISDFKLPLEIGAGFQTHFKKYFSLNFDYKKSFWNNTNQSDNLGNYIDQDFYGLGLQYAADKTRDGHFFKNLEYRAGFNYNNGNLEISNQRIDNYSLNLGIGIPLKRNRTNSMLNVGYSYGTKGQVNNGLIKENYHLLSINLSLEDIWFQKRKFQ